MTKRLVIVNPVAGRGRLQLDDGQLDPLIAQGVGRLTILGLVPRIMRGTHCGDPRLKLARARTVLIEAEAPLLAEGFEGVRRLEIAVLPGALRVLT